MVLTSLGYVPQKRDIYIDERKKEHRLLGADWRRLPGSNTYDLWFIHVGEDSEEASPFPLERGIFLANLQAGTWKKRNPPAMRPVSKKAAVSAHEKWQVLHRRVDDKFREDEELQLLYEFEAKEMKGSASPCLAWDMRLYRAHGRKLLLRCYQKALGVTDKTLLKWLRRYWRGGMVESALAPRWEDCGEDRSTLTKEKLAARGAPGRKIGSKEGQKGTVNPYRLTEEAKDAIWREVKPILEKYPNRPRKATYNEFWGMVQENKEGGLELADKGTYISEWQFYALLREKMGPHGEAKRKGGKGQYDNNKRPHTGTVLQEAVHAGQQYEIDSTVADIWLVADEPDKRHKIIGKPTVYFIVDRYSRFIVGWHATLDAPSWPSAMEAFMSIFEDPKERAKKLGLPFRPHLHVAAGKACDTLVGDRGTEYVCDMSDSFPNELGISMVALPAHMCPLHGIVESTIGLHHCSLANDAPGFQPPAEAMKRHGQSYEHDAEWSLREFRPEVQDWVDRYNESILKDMQQPLEAVYAEVPRIPVAMWNFSVDYHLGDLATYHIDDVYVSLLYECDAEVTHDGIQVGKLLYTSDEIANKREWLTTARDGQFTVRVKYDRRRTDDIIVIDPVDDTHRMKASLTEKYAEYRGKEFAEAEFAIALAEKTNADSARFNILKKAEYDRAAAPRREAARLKTEEAVRKAKETGESRTSKRPEVRGADAAAFALEDASRHMDRMFPQPPAEAPGTSQMPPQPPDEAAANAAPEAASSPAASSAAASANCTQETAEATQAGRKRKPQNVVTRDTVVDDPDKAMEAWDN